MRMGNDPSPVKKSDAKVNPRPSVAIVVPAPPPGRTFGEDERVSLIHLERYLGGYDRFLVVPPDDRRELEGFRRQQFSERYFGSVKAHNQLLMSKEFYRRFESYEFILIYHLDALVFADELPQWCAAGYDYIGAPWLADPNDWSAGFSGVGNGGFSLRRVSAALRVLSSRRYRVKPAEYWARNHGHRSWLGRMTKLPHRLAYHIVRLNGVTRDVATYGDNEDKFWSKRGPHYDPEFRVAPADVALRFAFETEPRACYELNGRQLPFGCHGWNRYDRSFWEQFLLTVADETETPLKSAAIG